GIAQLRERRRREVQARAHKAAEARVLPALVGRDSSVSTRESFRKKVRDDELNDKEIEVQVTDSGGGMPAFDIPGMPGAQIGMINISDMLGKAFGQRQKLRRVKVADAHGPLIAEESDKLIDNEALVQDAIALVEND